MKRILTTTAAALVLATSTGAFAQSNEQLREAVESQLSQYDVMVDVDVLPADTLSELYLITTGEDQDGVKEDKIMAALEDSDAVMMTEEDMTAIDMPMDQLRTQVSDFLGTNNIEADVTTLSDQQISALYLVFTSEMENAQATQRAESIIN